MKKEKVHWTGERLETFVYNQNTIEHLHRYAIALQLVSGKSVLDIACGEGYGSNILAQKAKNVLGVDVDSECVKSAKKKYVQDNLSFLSGSTSKIPANDETFDVVVSFETIEHHDKHDEMLMEIKRVLKKNGILIISTPDKLYYSDNTEFKNEHHVKELYKDEFKGLINNYFNHSCFFYQKADLMSVVIPETDPDSFAYVSGDYKSVVFDGDFEGVYVIAVASDHEISFNQMSVFNDPLIYKDVIKQLINGLYTSNAYKIGSFILKPFRVLRRLLNK